jgi:hypothetical protein
MGSKSSKRSVCFCAFCKTPHKIYKKKGIGSLQLSISLLLTVSFMWGFWGTWNLKAIPILLISIFLSELIMHFRWRLALICRQCGFDPLIYKKNPLLAASKVKTYLDRRKTDPSFLLAPAIKLPKRMKESLK